MAELADRVLLRRSGMTRLVDRLERDGLLERDTCTDDGRGCFAVLTDEGEELLAAGARRRTSTACASASSRHFPPDELRAARPAVGPRRCPAPRGRQISVAQTENT